MHCWEKKPTWSGHASGLLKRYFFLPCPKGLFLSQVCLAENLGFKNCFQGFWKWTTVCSGTAVVCTLGYLPSSANKQAFRHPLEQTFLCFHTSNKSSAHFGTVCTKSEKVKAVGGKLSLFWRRLPSKITYPLFQLHLIQASLTIGVARAEHTGGLGHAGGRSFDGDNFASAKSVLGIDARPVSYTVYS